MTDFMISRKMEEEWEKIDIFGVWEWTNGSWLYRSFDK